MQTSDWAIKTCVKSTQVIQWQQAKHKQKSSKNNMCLQTAVTIAL